MSPVAVSDAVPYRRLAWSFIAHTCEASLLCRVLVVCEGVVIRRCHMVREHRENRVCVRIILPEDRVDEVLHNVLQHIGSAAIGRIDSIPPDDAGAPVLPGSSETSRSRFAEVPVLESARRCGPSPAQKTGSDEEHTSMRSLAEFLSPEDILLDIDIVDKPELIARMAQFFGRRHGIDIQLAQQHLEAREALGSTGIGHGFAIPHARIPGLGQHLMVLIRSRSSLPFAAPDDKPVSVFLGLLLPEHASEMHLALLATAAKLFSSPDFRKRLGVCADASAVRDLLGGQ